MSNFLKTTFGRLFTGKERRRAETLEYLRENIQRELQKDIDRVMTQDIPKSILDNIQKIVEDEGLDQVVGESVSQVIQTDVQEVIKSSMQDGSIQSSIQQGLQANIKNLVEVNVQDNIQGLVKRNFYQNIRTNALDENIASTITDNLGGVREDIRKSIQDDIQNIIDTSIQNLALGTISEVTRLDLMGNSYILDEFDLVFSQDISEKEYFRDNPKCRITLTFNDIPDYIINQWMLDTTLQYDGVIRIFPYNEKVDESAKFTLTFNDAYCIGYKKKINVDNNELLTTIIISPRNLKIGKEEYENKWTKSNPLPHYIRNK